MNKRADTKEMTDPREETQFQPAKASGKSGYRRGAPAIPNQCCGKKVRLTPMKRTQKCILARVEL